MAKRSISRLRRRLPGARLRAVRHQLRRRRVLAVINAIGYFVVVAAVVIVLLSR